jgi:AMP-polyphosphate phosphotransferase
MLESAEVGHRIAKAVYRRDEPALREALLNAQFELFARQRGPLLVIISGVSGGGRSETQKRLTEWMDPRHIQVSAFGGQAPEEKVRPVQWRYWRVLPPRGRIGIFMDAWYGDVLRERIAGRMKPVQMEVALQEIRPFEQMLSDEGVVLLKFWIHLSREAQKARLKALAADPRTKWRVTEADWSFNERYDKARDLCEHALRETSTATAPWCVVEGTDERYRDLTVGKVILETLQRVTAPQPKTRAPRLTMAASPAPSAVDNVQLIRRLDLGRAVTEQAYERNLPRLQGKLDALTRRKRFGKHALVAVFEGVDAAGKGGAIRRVTAALDARRYAVIPVAAPTDEERAHPYLWRFWRQVPSHGRATIYDRSWYGRVLVERVEGFCLPADWIRAYDEINQFEANLADSGIVVVKFWLQIDRDEQLRRFRAREKTSFKRFKITPEDWRNRRKWDAYEKAVADMVDRTSTELAPWTLVPANDKYYARLTVLQTMIDRLQSVLD